MRSDRCRELDEGLHDPGRPKHQALRAWLDELGDVEDCIADGLRRSSEGEDWRGFWLYTLAAFQRPSRLYTAVLCEALGRRDFDVVNHEDIVDVLAEIRDPAAVACLRDTLWWEPEWDEYRNLAVKCIWALAAIGTPEALVVIRDATTAESLEVQEAAAHELEVIGKRQLRPGGSHDQREAGDNG